MLYKYLNWNERTIENIKNSQLYFNIPKNFNDLFDINPHFVFNSEIKKNVLDNIRKAYPSNEFFNISDLKLRDILKDTAIKMFNNQGVTCLSCDKANILMWSHYADKNKGICLGFNIDKEDKHLKKFLNAKKNKKILPNLDACLLLEVEYVQEDERPEINIMEIINGKVESISKTINTKFDKWSYEQEMRITCYAGRDSKIFPTALYYNPNCLKEVIFGASVTFNEFVERRKIISEISKDISFYIATLDEKDYKLNINKVDEYDLDIMKEMYDDFNSPNWMLECKKYKK